MKVQVQIILEILSLIFFILSDKRRLISQTKINNWRIIMYLCLILSTINFGVLGYRYGSSATKVIITHPYDGATVEMKEMVKGISLNIPKRHSIWVVVYSYLTKRYYPQYGPADIQVDGKWSSLILIGSERSIGEKHDIMAVLTDKSAEEIFNEYYRHGKERNIWEGLEKLPAGAKIYDRITVIRK